MWHKGSVTPNPGTYLAFVKEGQPPMYLNFDHEFATINNGQPFWHRAGSTIGFKVLFFAQGPIFDVNKRQQEAENARKFQKSFEDSLKK